MKKKFKTDITHLHRLIALSAALNYQLRSAEATRKEIAKLSLAFRKKK